MLKKLSNVYCITCHILYLTLRSFCKCLRRITEPLWRLTFWAYHLWRCDATRPLPTAPGAVKTKQPPLIDVRNAHRLTLDSDSLLSDLTNKTTIYFSPNVLYTLGYKVKSLKLMNRIQFTKLTHSNLDGNTPSVAPMGSSVLTVMTVLVTDGDY